MGEIAGQRANIRQDIHGQSCYRAICASLLAGCTVTMQDLCDKQAEVEAAMGESEHFAFVPTGYRVSEGLRIWKDLYK